MLNLKILLSGFKFFSTPFYLSRRAEIHRKYSALNDKKILLDDWRAVGNDFREVLRTYGK